MVNGGSSPWDSASMWQTQNKSLALDWLNSSHDVSLRSEPVWGTLFFLSKPSSQINFAGILQSLAMQLSPSILAYFNHGFPIETVLLREASDSIHLGISVIKLLFTNSRHWVYFWMNSSNTNICTPMIQTFWKYK